MKRREYAVNLFINRRRITKVIIDPHFEEKHSESISDQLILMLVETLDGQVFEAEQVKAPYSYFKQDRIELGGKFYRLIWLLEDDELYIGVINAYRR
jgi:hypothetical protein